MARASEKAQSMLALFRRARKLELEGESNIRPYLATECNTVKECERWRQQIVREVAKMVAQIQNAGLGEFRLRDLNDEINKKLREKNHWQDRIKDLGGPDYRKVGPKMLDREGKQVPGDRGYKYFGAARDLPGVRELFEAAPAEAPRRKRGELFTHIDADYYGYRDEEDGILLPLEAEAEEYAVAEAVAEWQAKQQNMQGGVGGGAGTEAGAGAAAEDEEEADLYAEGAAFDKQEKDDETMDLDADEDQADLAVHEDLPSQEDMAKLLLERKRELLLKQYASTDLQAQGEMAKSLAGKVL